MGQSERKMSGRSARSNTLWAEERICSPKLWKAASGNTSACENVVGGFLLAILDGGTHLFPEAV